MLNQILDITLDKSWNFGPAFDPSESRSSPDTTRDELEP